MTDFTNAMPDDTRPDEMTSGEIAPSEITPSESIPGELTFSEAVPDDVSFEEITPDEMDDKIDPQLRGELHEALDRWLDRLDVDASDELELPEEIWQLLDDEPDDEVASQASLAALWSNMAVLSQEVKLQSRSFKQMGMQLKEFCDCTQSQADAFLAASTSSSRSVDANEVDAGMIAFAKSLFDARESLLRACGAAELQMRQTKQAEKKAAEGRESEKRAAEKKPWGISFLLGRKRGLEVSSSEKDAGDISAQTCASTELNRSSVQSIVDGAMLAAERLEHALRKYHIFKINALGQPFDPNTMKAVSVTHDPQHPDGIVVQTMRTGYQRGGEVLRVSEVAVNRVQNDIVTNENSDKNESAED